MVVETAGLYRVEIFVIWQVNSYFKKQYSVV